MSNSIATVSRRMLVLYAGGLKVESISAKSVAARHLLCAELNEYVEPAEIRPNRDQW